MVGGKMERRTKMNLLATFYYLLWRAKYYPDKEVTLRVLGMKITADKPKTIQQTLLEIFVHEVYRFDSQLEAPAILDAGATIGMASLYFTLRYPMPQVIAVEPNPKAVAYLKRNLTSNNLSNVHLNEVALDADTGFGSLIESPESLLNAAVSASALTTPISVVALTSLMEKHSVDLMKSSMTYPSHTGMPR
jgi:FkbM family methyltransferase